MFYRKDEQIERFGFGGDTKIAGKSIPTWLLILLVVVVIVLVFLGIWFLKKRSSRKEKFGFRFY